MEEMSKLAALLDYIIKHNEEHAEEIREYAAKARALGNEAAQADIEKGVVLLEESNAMLRQARETMK